MHRYDGPEEDSAMDEEQDHINGTGVAVVVPIEGSTGGGPPLSEFGIGVGSGGATVSGSLGGKRKR